MTIKAKDITDALMNTQPRPNGKTTTDNFKKWQAELEKGYEKLCDLGAKIVEEFFTSNPMGVCGAAPWGALPADKNIFRPEWEAFEKTLPREIKDDKAKLKQVKEAIYMGSQEIWLDQEKALKEVDLSGLTYIMRNRLITLKNDYTIRMKTKTKPVTQKSDFLIDFFGDKSQNKSQQAFVQALNLNYYSHKHCGALLRKIDTMKAEIERLKNTPTEDRAEWKLPDNPTIKVIAEAMRRGLLLEVVENENYYKYMANSGNFAKLPKEEREALRDIVDKWTERLNDIEKYHEAIDTLRHVIKASMIL